MESADKDLREIVKNRLIGEAKDGFPLRPHGWVASMNAPIEDDDGNVRDDLTPVQRLELQGQEEQLWLTQKLLSKQARSDLSSRLGCNALIQKMKTAFHSYVKDTWAPFALFRLEGESARLSFEQATLGLPPAHTQLEGVLLEELQTEAIEAAERILNECIGDRVNAAYERATAADAAAATSKSSMRGLAALSEWAAKRHAELRRTSLEALKMAIVDVHDTLIADASSFKLGRFPMFVDAAVTELNDAIRRTVNHEDNLALVGGPSLRDLLKRAVASTAVSGWLERESCAAKRHRLDALAAGIAPAKTSITKLLNAQSPEDILIAANLNTRHLTSCRVDEVAFTGCTIAMEMHFELTVNEDAQLAGKLPWVGELRGPDGNGVPVHFHNVSPGKYAGTFTPTLKAFPLALCCDLRCSLTIRLHEVVVPQSSIPVLVKMLTTTSQKCAAWKKAGVSIDSLVAAGLRVDELKSCGYSALELKGVGFSATELGEAGFSAAELARAGFEAIKMGKYAEEARLEVGQSVLVSGFGHATIVKLGRKVKVEYDDGSTYHVLCSQLSRLEVGQSVLVNGFGHATIVKLGRKVKVEYDDGSTYHVLRSQLSLDDSGEIDESSSDDLLDWE